MNGRPQELARQASQEELAMTNTDRADYIEGLRALADLLERHDDLPLPNTGTSNPFDWWIFPSQVSDVKATLARLVRLMPGNKSKAVGEGSGTAWVTITGRLHGLTIDLNTYRDVVCTRRVVATREVTEEVPDPDAVAALPKVTVTKTVEDVEWDCQPLLAGAHR